jgi:hypothetical protein
MFFSFRFPSIKTFVLYSRPSMMALFVHHSPFHFFDNYIADYYRQMAYEMEQMRRNMFQLVPPEALLIPALEGVCSEVEPLVPVVEENGERKMKLEFNVKDYKPDEVKVKMVGNNVLQVRRCASISSFVSK